jgi:hypothetical protein
MFTNDLKSILHNNNNNTQQITNSLPQWFTVTAKRLKGGNGKLHGASVAVYHSINASTEVACI